MFTFKEFMTLTEAKAEQTGGSKPAVFTFGRFNPPTKGHEKLVDKVLHVATEKGATPFVFPSQSVDKPLKSTGKVNPDKSKNPLPLAPKVAFMKAIFPHAANHITTVDAVKTPWQVPEWLGEQGFTDIYMVVGDDRVNDFQRLADAAAEHFDHFEIVSAGERDPDGEGIEGMSATKARAAARAGDLAAFRAATGWDGEIAERMMHEVRRGMGVE